MKVHFKRLISSLLVFIMVLGLLACSPKEEPATVQEEPATKQETTYTATHKGFGGDVTVNVTIVDGVITNISAKGDNETPEIGGKALVELPQRIVSANSTNVDIIAGATFTSKAIIIAVEDTLIQAGVLSDIPSVVMKPGTYTGEGWGFDWIEPIRVNVTVSDKELLKIEVIDKDINREEPLILKAAEDKLIPRIIEHQSISVDGITGATGSSNGIKAATEDALKKALLAAGTDESAIKNFYKTTAKKTDTTETINVDVLVVGMGGAGCAAATSAAEAQKAAGVPVSVLAIDKAGKYGGTAANCGEPFGINSPRYKEAFNNGEDYTEVESLYDDWINNFAKGDAKEDLVRLFLEESGKTIDWLYFDHGFLLNNPLPGFGENTWRVKYQYVYHSNREEGRDYGKEDIPFRSEAVGSYFDNIVKDFTEMGGKYMLETNAYELIYDDTADKVVGVKASGYDGTEYIIYAKAVILATGGFAGNPEMEEKYLSNEHYPLKAPWKIWGMSQNTGDMIQSAIDNGAGTYNIDMVPIIHFKTTTQFLREYPVHYRDGVDERTGKQNTWSLNDVPMILGLNSSAMQVGREGKRCYNEAGIFEFWKSGPDWFTIYGEDNIADLAKNGFAGEKGTYMSSTRVYGQGGYPKGIPIPEIYEVLDKAIEKGYVYKADTLEELAEKIGVPAQNLVSEVEKYNRFCETGVDEDFGKPAKNLISLGEKGPYYAINACSVAYATCGGLDVDTNLNVLKEDGISVMNGVYAAGNDSSGVLYSNRDAYAQYGGVALGWAFTSGRLAGQNAVKYILENN